MHIPVETTILLGATEFLSFFDHGGGADAFIWNVAES
jgi:hypothetical protein